MIACSFLAPIISEAKGQWAVDGKKPWRRRDGKDWRKISIGPVIYVIILLTLSSALHRCHPWGHFTDGVTEALKGTHSKLPRPCRGPGLLSSPLSRPLTQTPPPGPLPEVASAHQTSLIAGRRWTRRGQALLFRRRKARPESQGRIASQHCFTPDTSLPSSEPPPKTASDARLRWDIPSPGGRRGRLTQQKPPSPPGPGAPGRGSGSRWGFARPVLFGPGPPPGLPARRFLTSSTKSIARARAGRSPRAAPRFSSRDNGGSLWPNQPPEGPGGRERFPRGRR